MVEDHPLNRKLIASLARKWGLIVKEASTVTEALASLGQPEKFDVVLLDMQLPEKNGFNLAEAIRRNPGCKSVPLVLLSSIRLRAGDERLAALGFSVTLHKPIRSTADDNPLNQKVGSLLLEKMGYRADVVANGMEVVSGAALRYCLPRWADA